MLAELAAQAHEALGSALHPDLPADVARRGHRAIRLLEAVLADPAGVSAWDSVSNALLNLMRTEVWAHQNVSHPASTSLLAALEILKRVPSPERSSLIAPRPVIVPPPPLTWHTPEESSLPDASPAMAAPEPIPAAAPPAGGTQALPLWSALQTRALSVGPRRPASTVLDGLVGALARLAGRRQGLGSMTRFRDLTAIDDAIERTQAAMGWLGPEALARLRATDGESDGGIFATLAVLGVAPGPGPEDQIAEGLRGRFAAMQVVGGAWSREQIDAALDQDEVVAGAVAGAVAACGTEALLPRLESLRRNASGLPRDRLALACAVLGSSEALVEARARLAAGHLSGPVIDTIAVCGARQDLLALNRASSHPEFGDVARLAAAHLGAVQAGAPAALEACSADLREQILRALGSTPDTADALDVRWLAGVPWTLQGLVAALNDPEVCQMRRRWLALELVSRGHAAMTTAPVPWGLASAQLHWLRAQAATVVSIDGRTPTGRWLWRGQPQL